MKVALSILMKFIIIKSYSPLNNLFNVKSATWNSPILSLLLLIWYSVLKKNTTKYQVEKYQKINKLKQKYHLSELQLNQFITNNYKKL